MRKISVYSTKELPEALIESAKESRIEITGRDFITIHPLWSEEKMQMIASLVKSGVQTAAFTSANGVMAADHYIHLGEGVNKIDWQFFSLSGRTKEKLYEAQFLKGVLLNEAETAAGLAEKITASGIKELIFFCGDQRRDELPQLLSSAGIIVHEAIVYETKETPEIITEHPDAILFFSPSAVASFFNANNIHEKTVCFAIGGTTAASLKNFTTNKIISSPSPSQEMMLMTVRNYMNSIATHE